MNIQKPIIFLVLGLVFIVVMIVVLTALNTKPKDKTSPNPEVIQAPIVTPITTPIKNLPLEKQLIIQTEADNNTTNIKNEIMQKYPWYNKLPLQETNYFVYFSLDKQVFIGKLYPQKSSSTSTEEQTLNWQREIPVKLQSFGVDLSVYNIIWEVSPE